MFLTDDPDVVGPLPQVEEEYGLGPGLIWTIRRRSIFLLQVTWPIDLSGGEVPPATWTVGADTYDLVNVTYGRTYSKLNGTFTAYYSRKGDWAWD